MLVTELEVFEIWHFWPSRPIRVHFQSNRRGGYGANEYGDPQFLLQKCDQDASVSTWSKFEDFFSVESFWLENVLISIQNGRNCSEPP